MKGNEGPKAQNERKGKPKKSNLKISSAHMHGFFFWRPAITASRSEEADPQRKPRGPAPNKKWQPKGQNKGNEGPKVQNERKQRPNRPKRQEIKALTCMVFVLAASNHSISVRGS